MDFKKLIADLAARYRKLTEPISSSSLAPPGQVVDVDAAHEAGRKAGYEAGYKKGYDEGLQVGLEAKTLPEPSGPKSQSESPPPSLSLYERLGGVYSIATVIDDFIDRVMMDPRLNANPRVDEAHHRVPPAGFKYLVTEMLCWAAGGPQKYTGRPEALCLAMIRYSLLRYLLGYEPSKIHKIDHRFILWADPA